MAEVLIDWRLIIEHVWRGGTVPQAFEEQGLSASDRHRAFNGWPEMKGYLVELSMVASVREDLLK